MSIMMCDNCDRHVDTDYNVEGIYTGDNRYVCSKCADEYQLYELVKGDSTELTLKELMSTTEDGK